MMRTVNAVRDDRNSCATNARHEMPDRSWLRSVAPHSATTPRAPLALLPTRRQAYALTESAEKVWTSYFNPPRKNAVPSTRSRLDITEPSSESCTMRRSPERIAKSETIISVALPKVALRSPPTVAEVCKASCSVT
eukprot:scaffold9305_cov29-Tisochrysis_lutea.AAC.2